MDAEDDVLLSRDLGWPPAHVEAEHRPRDVQMERAFDLIVTPARQKSEHVGQGEHVRVVLLVEKSVQQVLEHVQADGDGRVVSEGDGAVGHYSFSLPLCGRSLLERRMYLTPGRSLLPARTSSYKEPFDERRPGVRLAMNRLACRERKIPASA